jgi:hypothetical protein
VLLGEAEGKEIIMKTHFGHAVAALALVVGTGPAAAQWIYTDASVAARPAVTEPLPLTQAQRTTIYRTIIPQGRNRQPIVRERIVTEPVAPPVVRERVVTGQPVDLDAYAYGYLPADGPRVVVREPDPYGSYAYVGTRVAPNAQLTPLPPAAIAAVPSARQYRYMVINQRLLLVDPDTGIVVADLTR